MERFILGALLLAATPALAQDPGTVRVAAAPAATGSLLAQARELLARNQAAAAYGLLAPRELELAGSPQYDYLLGMAALDSGRPTEAVFTLERLVAAVPDFDGARMELARAHYEAGDLPAAREQFSYLLTRNPPDQTRLIIGRYLSAIDARAAGRGPGLTTYVEVGAGYDSNANGSTDDGQFLGFDLDADNVETDSSFFSLAAGLNHGRDYGNGWSSDSFLRASYRNNPDASFVDRAIVSAGGNLNRALGAWRLNGGASGYADWLDGSEHEAYGGLNLGLARFLADRWELRLQASGGALRYQEEALEVLDVNRYLGSLGITRYGLGPREGRLSLVLLAGTDAEREAGSPYGNDRLGARLTGSMALGSGSALVLELGFLTEDYDDSPGFFGEDREDDQYTALLATEYRNWPAPDWSLVPSLRYVRNDSNIALYEYDRWEAGVTLRRSFR